jgi:hypothetical protein
MTKHVLAPALAIVALASATTAQAQQQTCVAAADLGDTVLYAMPIAYDAVSTTCKSRLKADGFMAKGGDKFIAKFRERQDSAWPGAFRLLKTFMAKDAGAEAGAGADMGAMIAALPEQSLRPFVDGLVGQMIAEEIKPDSCGKIERGLELLSPLPVDNVAGLMAFIAEVGELKDPQICGTAPSAKAK